VTLSVDIIILPHTTGIAKHGSCSNEILIALLTKAFYPVGLLYIYFISKISFLDQMVYFN